MLEMCSANSGCMYEHGVMHSLKAASHLHSPITHAELDLKATVNSFSQHILDPYLFVPCVIGLLNQS
jgi:hypothetical protein